MKAVRWARSMCSRVGFQTTGPPKLKESLMIASWLKQFTRPEKSK
jgi:hypothetical protein